MSRKLGDVVRVLHPSRHGQRGKIVMLISDDQGAWYTIEWEKGYRSSHPASEVKKG